MAQERRLILGFELNPPPRVTASSNAIFFMTQVRLLERSIALKDLALAEMERTIQEMEASSFDGVFIWKITDIARKRQEAISGRSPAIFSPGYLAKTATTDQVGRRRFP